MHDIFLLLGSNLGNRETYLERARIQIDQKIGSIKRGSSLYLTESWGKTDQPEYINQVVEVSSSLEAREVLREINSIEALLERQRTEKWGTRAIDIDILFYDDILIDEDDLIVPHRYLHERRFTLEPLLELEPNFLHPRLRKTIKELYSELSDNLKVKRLNTNN